MTLYVNLVTEMTFGFLLPVFAATATNICASSVTAKPLRHHVLLDLQNMPQTQQLSTSTHIDKSGDLTKPCPKHAKEMIQFYCHDHRALTCSVCVTLEHTQSLCCISYISDISDQSLNSQEYADVLKSMAQLHERCRKITADLKQMTAESNASIANVLEEIRKFRQEINEKLDEFEKTCEDEAKAIQQENDERLQTVLTACDDAAKRLKAMSDAIKQLNTSKQADKLFMELKLAEQIIQDTEENIPILPSPKDPEEYEFHPNLAISSFLGNEKSLGTLQQKAAHSSSSLLTESLKPILLTNQGEINVKTISNKERCWITGMVVLSPTKLILSDYKNKSIKMVDVNSNSVTDQIGLGTVPREVAVVNKDELVVVLPEKETVQFLSVSPNGLALKHTVDVDGECRGICCYQDELILAFCSPPKLEITDMNGRVQTRVLTNSSGGFFFSKPKNVVANSNGIYLVDETMRKVFVLNWRGEITRSLEVKELPQRIALLDDGSLFVSEYTGMGTIHHVSGDLKDSNKVLENLPGPNAICWCNIRGNYMSVP